MHFKIKRFLFPLLALLGSCDDNPKDPIVQFKQMKYESQESKKSLSDALFKTYPDTMDKINTVQTALRNLHNAISKMESEYHELRMKPELKELLSDILLKRHPDEIDKINPIKNSANEISKLKEDLS
ncbi:hypothetical protein RH08_00480 [Candidatus Liberibacter asiaticus]|uniref:Lipoprotein n=1 Tax=Candidatus Liberibacter asiaticus str. gxpsy TaxID=1174529 RepID=A0ABN4B117_LIBAS|nr:hypothetical protein WSI_00435 [Candidatus Liberibacter asiaticus str. gxpsy]ASK52335.1 hypothetical protein B2I23_00465 [Candidatus Liberibacter asiaticus]AWL13658.1 hypothetical protein DIC79_00480 [Candidatus Liberibacter asiaticus]KAE9514816.1 hypothetical protein FXW25_00435 [Candidatus Liberibacter asiaticus]KAE9516937.1 hypothetical protein FXW27_00430 [Candidatus Liberibacter asiaticus]